MTILPDLAIVTGAGRGIGRAAAKALAAKGVEVLCVSQSAHCAELAKEIIAQGGKAEALQIDLGDYATAQKEIEKYLDKRQPKKLALVAAAGILGPTGPLTQSDLAAWEQTFRVNVLGNLAVLQVVLPFMQKNAFGRVVMFAGGGSAYAYPMFPAYAASKTALVRATENIAVDMKDAEDFSIVILAPGAIETDMLATVRASGGEVRTTTDIKEPVDFVCNFLQTANAKNLNGRFIHVRDIWQDKETLSDDHWKLRRVE